MELVCREDGGRPRIIGVGGGGGARDWGGGCDQLSHGVEVKLVLDAGGSTRTACACGDARPSTPGLPMRAETALGDTVALDALVAYHLLTDSRKCHGFCTALCPPWATDSRDWARIWRMRLDHQGIAVRAGRDRLAGASCADERSSRARTSRIRNGRWLELVTHCC